MWHWTDSEVKWYNEVEVRKNIFCINNLHIDLHTGTTSSKCSSVATMMYGHSGASGKNINFKHG